MTYIIIAIMDELHKLLQLYTNFVFDDDTNKLYAGPAIYKKKLAPAKYRGLMANVLKKLNAGSWAFETYAEQKPPSDETTAAIVDIMGGGEEVKINE